MRIEADARHVDLLIQDLGLDRTKTKPVAHPGAKVTQADVDRRRREPELERRQASRYRSSVMRASVVAQDRPDIAEAVKSLAQFMIRPGRSLAGPKAPWTIFGRTAIQSSSI